MYFFYPEKPYFCLGIKMNCVYSKVKSPAPALSCPLLALFDTFVMKLMKH